MIDLEDAMKSRSSVSSTQGHTKQKTIDMELPDVQLKKGRSAYMLCQNVQIVAVIIKQPYLGAQQGKKLRH